MTENVQKRYDVSSVIMHFSRTFNSRCDVCVLTLVNCTCKLKRKLRFVLASFQFTDLDYMPYYCLSMFNTREHLDDSLVFNCLYLSSSFIFERQFINCGVDILSTWRSVKPRILIKISQNFFPSSLMADWQTYILSLIYMKETCIILLRSCFSMLRKSSGHTIIPWHENLHHCTQPYTSNVTLSPHYTHSVVCAKIKRKPADFLIQTKWCFWDKTVQPLRL